MFTGIVASLGEVVGIEKQGTNIHLRVKSALSSQFKIDQSIAHNGVCLTVVKVEGDVHEVVAVDETMKKTNLGSLKIGDEVNLEEAMMMQARLDGHLVQGHVDTVIKCLAISEQGGSWLYSFSLGSEFNHLLVEKGSICINGISLTAFDVREESFKVAIIPYTYAHTNLHAIKVGDMLNVEFDIVGKYVARIKFLNK